MTELDQTIKLSFAVDGNRLISDLIEIGIRIFDNVTVNTRVDIEEEYNYIGHFNNPNVLRREFVRAKLCFFFISNVDRADNSFEQFKIDTEEFNKAHSYKDIKFRLYVYRGDDDGGSWMEISTHYHFVHNKYAPLRERFLKLKTDLVVELSKK